MTSIDREISKMYKAAESIRMLSNEGVYHATHHDGLSLEDFTMADRLRYDLITKQGDRLWTAIGKLEKTLLEGGLS